VGQATKMQTLNVRAGQTQEEYLAAEHQRREDLRVDSQGDATYFFWAAGLAALSTRLFPIRVDGIASIGLIELARFYKGSPLTLYGMTATWIIVLLALGFAARAGHRWAFLLGIALYGADMIALTMLFSILAFGVHAFFVYRWFQGQNALQELKQI